MKYHLIKKNILLSLFRKHIWGSKHCDAEHVFKNCPSHFKGIAKIVLKTLIKEGIIIRKKTPYGSGLHVSLNPRMKKQIEDIIFSE